MVHDGIVRASQHSTLGPAMLLNDQVGDRLGRQNPYGLMRGVIHAVLLSDRRAGRERVFQSPTMIERQSAGKHIFQRIERYPRYCARLLLVGKSPTNIPNISEIGVRNGNNSVFAQTGLPMFLAALATALFH